MARFLHAQKQHGFNLLTVDSFFQDVCQLPLTFAAHHWCATKSFVATVHWKKNGRFEWKKHIICYVATIDRRKEQKKNACTLDEMKVYNMDCVVSSPAFGLFAISPVGLGVSGRYCCISSSRCVAAAILKYTPIVCICIPVAFPLIVSPVGLF